MFMNSFPSGIHLETVDGEAVDVSCGIDMFRGVLVISFVKMQCC